MTDQLVRRAQRGDKDAFVALMEQYKAALYRAARAILHSDEDAADAIQETVLEAWRSLPKLEAPRYCKTWLTRVLEKARALSASDARRGARKTEGKGRVTSSAGVRRRERIHVYAIIGRPKR